MGNAADLSERFETSAAVAPVVKTVETVIDKMEVGVEGVEADIKTLLAQAEDRVTTARAALANYTSHLEAELKDAIIAARITISTAQAHIADVELGIRGIDSTIGGWKKLVDEVVNDANPVLVAAIGDVDRVVHEAGGFVPVAVKAVEDATKAVELKAPAFLDWLLRRRVKTPTAVKIKVA